MLFSNVKPGDRVEWMTVNGERSGTVASVSDMGVLVDADRGGQSLLSTKESMIANHKARTERLKQFKNAKNQRRI